MTAPPAASTRSRSTCIAARSDPAPGALAVAPAALYARRMERTVHVCNGDITADLISLAELPGDVRVWADALDQGPVLPVSDAEHYQLRTEFWRSRGARTDAPDVATYDKNVDDTSGAEEVILWFEHDLFDQLALVRLL